jgi:hypothetical protein
MEEAQTQTQPKEQTRQLVENIEKVVEKLKQLPKNQYLEKVMDRACDIGKDIKEIVYKDFDKKEDFDNFWLMVHWKYGIRVYTPIAKIDVAYLHAECLEEKSVYECLKQKFSNKIPIINKLLEEFADAVNDFADELYLLLFGEKEDDP